MKNSAPVLGPQIRFSEMEQRFGQEGARAILHTLEQMEGVRDENVANLSYEDRLANVFNLMSENLRYQTRH